MDHIPPTLLFPEPKPTLITVPCCSSCNGAAATDDEYFRLAIAIREDVAERTDVRSILPAIYRSLMRPKARGLNVLFNRALVRKDVISAEGLVLGNKPAFKPDMIRLGRVAQRIVTGLFYYKTGRRLPDDHVAQAFMREGFDDHQKYIQALELAAPFFVRNAEPEAIGSVFKFWHSFPLPDRPNISIWILVFYDHVVFLCQTLPRDEAAAGNLRRAIASGSPALHLSPIPPRRS
jgi:hypothetical protein